MTAPEKEYWDQVAQEFDTFYREEKAALGRAIDKIFRKAIAERSNLTLQECKSINGKKVIDIGCGTGRLAIQLAKRGAYVVGIDPSQNSLDMASLMAEKEQLQKSCMFIQGDFEKHIFNEKFDISLALGFFDHAKDPALSIKKIRSVTTQKCIMSFPAKFAFQVPLRMIWLRSRNIPVYFYTKKKLKRLFEQHFTRYKFKNISAGYFCVASVQERK